MNDKNDFLADFLMDWQIDQPSVQPARTIYRLCMYYAAFYSDDGRKCMGEINGCMDVCSRPAMSHTCTQFVLLTTPMFTDGPPNSCFGLSRCPHMLFILSLYLISLLSPCQANTGVVQFHTCVLSAQNNHEATNIQDTP